MDEFIKESRQFWESFYQRELSDEDVKQIIANTRAFFEILMEWDDDGDEPIA